MLQTDLEEGEPTHRGGRCVCVCVCVCAVRSVCVLDHMLGMMQEFVMV